MMSISALLAQTTVPTTLPGSEATQLGNLLFLTLIVTWAAIALWLVASRNLLSIPPLPPASNRVSPGVLLGILIAAAAAYIGVAGVAVRLLGTTAPTTPPPATISAVHPTTTQAAEPANVRIAILCQPIAQLTAAALILSMLISSGLMPQLLQWRRPGGHDLLHGLATWALVFPWVVLVGMVLQAMTQKLGIKADQEHVIFALWKGEPAGFSPLKATMLLSAVVTAPIAEELFFRGVLQRLLYRLTHVPGIAILLASLAFAATHQPWMLQPPVFILALVLGWAYFRTGSILVPIIAHAVFNATEFAIFIGTGGK